MEFKKNQSIYLQIAEHICEQILTRNWEEGEKISSVRELAANIEVNPNTIMRTYSHLQDEGIIQNKRGIGYFVADGAPESILELQRKEFIDEELPLIFKKMKLLKIDMALFQERFKKFLKN